MQVYIRTISGQGIRSTNVTHARVLWFNTDEAVDLTIEQFQEKFILDKSQILAVTFKGDSTIFVGGDNIDYIVISNS